MPVYLGHTGMSQLTLACVTVTIAKVLSPYFVLGLVWGFKCASPSHCTVLQAGPVIVTTSEPRKLGRKTSVLSPKSV